MIPATALVVSLSVLMLVGGSFASSFATREEQEAYLKKYAYMGSSSPDHQLAAIKDPNEMFRMAVKKFQKMAGINETGVVDRETVKMMKMPRCGLPDEVGMSMVARRRRRHAAQGSRWPRTGLTYRINNYTPDLPQNVTDLEIQKAFQRWSDVSPLTFNKVTDRGEDVNIDIYFHNQDGENGTLAYAYFPFCGGNAHFDEEETWTSKTKSGTNLLMVAIHEFGHSLGLSHSDVKDAIMFPYYRGYRPDASLHSDDIAGIQYIYGRPSKTRPVQTTHHSTVSPRSHHSSTKPMPPTGHDICRDSSVDAIFVVKDDIYVFKGAEYYKGLHRGRRYLSSAMPISTDWPRLPNNIDTAVYLDGSIVFFKGHQCWRYNSSRQPIGRNPQSISTVFAGLPSDIDAAFVWSGNGKPYIIKGGAYYRMSKLQEFDDNYHVDDGFPRPLSTWNGLPSKIDAAFNYTNGRTYFFSNSRYYRFNDVRFRVDSGYPKSTAKYWLGCDNKLDVKKPEVDVEWMAGGDQFVPGGVGQLMPDGGDQFVTDDGDQAMMGGVRIPTYSVFLSTIALLALCLLFP